MFPRDIYFVQNAAFISTLPIVRLLKAQSVQRETYDEFMINKTILFLKLS